jgi:hypothetical protein
MVQRMWLWKLIRRGDAGGVGEGSVKETKGVEKAQPTTPYQQGDVASTQRGATLEASMCP